MSLQELKNVHIRRISVQHMINGYELYLKRSQTVKNKNKKLPVPIQYLHVLQIVEKDRASYQVEYVSSYVFNFAAVFFFCGFQRNIPRTPTKCSRPIRAS